MSYVDDFRDAMRGAGITPPDHIEPDSAFHRFDAKTGKPRKDGAGFYKLHGDGIPAGVFGDWAQQMTVRWCSKDRQQMTPDERAAHRAFVEQAERERHEAEIAQRAATAERARGMLASARPAEDAAHPYLQRKRLPGLGAFVLGAQLLVPVYQAKGKLAGLQVIPADGDKKFLTGTHAQGGYMTVGQFRRGQTIVICEGWATGASIHLATQFYVVVAFSAGSLAEVANKLRAAMPDARLVIAADDDAFTVRPERHPQAGEPWNPGIEAAAAAALAVGGTYVLPRWAGERGRGTDFNDLHAAEGLDAVRACFDDEIEPGPPADESPFHVAQPAPAEPAPRAALPAPPPRAAAELAAEPSDFAPEYSETDIAARHVERMGGNVLWCEAWGKWMVWSGSRWVRDDTLMVRELVTHTCKAAANEILGRHDIGEAKRLTRAEKLTSYRGIVAVEQLARSDRRIASHPDEWDADRWLLNTPGGVVDLRTGTIRPHDQADRLTKATSVAPGGGCPTWLQFLDRATGGDKSLQAFLKRMCGYSLTGEVREHAFFFVYGTGGNGKGTFLNTLTAIMGDYQRVSGAEVFTEQANDRHTTELARLHGARLVTAQETEEGKRWAEARIKALTGGDPITARYMRQDDFTFDPQFKLVIVGNHKPSFRSVDDAIKRRLHLIPFTATIPANEKDPELPAKLRAESGGILAWMIEGCTEWARDGLRPPPIVKESTERYLDAEDSLQQWLNECCIVDPIKFAASASLFASWQRWCEESGEFPGSQKRLMGRLESRGIRVGQKFQGRRGCLGIGLLSTHEVESDAY